MPIGSVTNMAAARLIQQRADEAQRMAEYRAYQELQTALWDGSIIDAEFTVVDPDQLKIEGLK